MPSLENVKKDIFYIVISTPAGLPSASLAGWPSQNLTALTNLSCVGVR